MVKLMTDKRLIEVAFPLKQASLDSVHEKNVRHGHISTLHIWPARRPMAACRAALIATLLPDPGDPAERKLILEKLAGKVVQRPKKKKDAEGRSVEEMVEETEGGILHWGRENSPDLEWFRQKIREAYGGRAPRVLDPFAGGGAIPLEAMRLGCEATAVDINPVAWFILKCTLEYPQKLAGQKLPLPGFVLQDREFMEDYLKAQGFKGKELEIQLEKLGFGNSLSQLLPGMEVAVVSLEADLAWHVRAWGRWVLKEARKELAPYYPTYADFEPLVAVTSKLEQRPMTLVPLKGDGMLDVDLLNAKFSPEYLADKFNPRWVAKPTVAYLWARTVTCKNCRATLPLLKTRWLCKKPGKRVLLTMQPNPEKTGVVFGVQADVPVVGKNAAERKAHDTQVGGGTMSRSGATCPCCGGIMTMEDVRMEGQAGRLGQTMTAVVVDGQNGKEYRTPTAYEIEMANKTQEELDRVYAKIPLGLPEEYLPSKEALGFRVPLYGIEKWKKLFTLRQQYLLGVLIKKTRQFYPVLLELNYPSSWVESIYGYLSLVVSKLLDYNSSMSTWNVSTSATAHGFTRWALPITWDFAEANPLVTTSGSYSTMAEWLQYALQTVLNASMNAVNPTVKKGSAIAFNTHTYFDIIITDPPYYDAIPYSDLMDFFYIWQRRLIWVRIPVKTISESG
jgi:adenine-specific DNA methylase